MSGTDDLDEIRERKREELKRKLEEGGISGGPDSDGNSSEAETAPSDPIGIDGPDHLREVVQRYPVVLVDFYADWCGPCKQLEPIVADLADETRAAIAKVDIDVHQQLAAEHSVRGVPTLLLYVDGEPTDRVVGMRGKDQLAELIARHT